MEEIKNFPQVFLTQRPDSEFEYRHTAGTTFFRISMG